MALGITWILDGLDASRRGTMGGVVLASGLAPSSRRMPSATRPVETSCGEPSLWVLLTKEAVDVPMPFQNIHHLKSITEISKEDDVVPERRAAHVGSQLRS